MLYEFIGFNYTFFPAFILLLFYGNAFMSFYNKHFRKWNILLLLKTEIGQKMHWRNTGTIEASLF